MRIAILSILLISILSCAEKTAPVDSVFVQQQQIGIAQPRVTATSTIIDSTVSITAALALEDVALYYTNDGTAPTENNTKYIAPITVEKEGTYSFKAFHADWKPSKTTTLQLYKKGIIPRKLFWNTKPNSKYPGVDSITLMNHTKGSVNFRDTQWVGYDTTAIATMYFKYKPRIKNITIGYLIDTKSWIFPPEAVEVYINKTHRIRYNVSNIPKGELKKLEDFQIPINRNVETMTIRVYNSKLPDWHPGKGMNAWLFMDEWIFNE